MSRIGNNVRAIRRRLEYLEGLVAKIESEQGSEAARRHPAWGELRALRWAMPILIRELESTRVDADTPTG